MDFVGEALRYARMVPGALELARTPALPNPEDNLRGNLAAREANFLEVAARAIYGNPRNPYCKMLELAQCPFPELEQSVRRDGLEATLEALRRAGVYLSHDEMKGKQPIVRSGVTIASDASSYANPTVSARIEARSSGSRSTGTRTALGLASQLHWEQYQAVLARDLGFDRDEFVAMLPILPSMTGLLQSLRGRRFNWNVEKWFAAGGTLRDSWHFRTATSIMVMIGKMAGIECCFPTYLPENDFAPVAEYIARRKTEGERCCLGGFVSPAVRVATAAMERGLDISGTIFSVGGEALTPAKRATMEAAGGQVYPFYAIVELGPVGYACRNMKTGNCVHLFEDLLAVITHQKRAALSEAEVNSLMFTTLTPYAPRVLINAEMDDSGTIEEVSCDCLFGQIGYGRQIRDIGSYGKLTGQGMTLTGTDVVRILEEVLPRRCGGSPGDYQLVEEESEAQTVVTLRVSPRAGVSNLDEVERYFLEQLRQLYGGTLTARMWQHAEAVRVVLAEPFATITGKVLPLHLLNAHKSDS